MLARGLEGIKYFLNICTCFYAQNYLIRRSLEFFANAKNRDDVFGYSYAKVLALALVLSISIISESWAACVGATATTAGTDEENKPCGTWDCGAQGSDVTCTLSKGTLTISGEGAMKDYSWEWLGTTYPLKYKTDAPWGGTRLTKASIEGNITRIGQGAFLGESYFTEISGMENVETIGRSAFEKTSLQSIDIPNVTELDQGVFYDCSQLVYINMKSDVEILSGWNPFNSVPAMSSCVSNPETGMKTCGSCGDKYVKSGTGCVSECGSGYEANTETNTCDKLEKGCTNLACTSCEKYYYKKEAGCVYFKDGCGEGWLEKDSVCIEASEGCGNSYKDMGGYCNRVIYTPAEAAPLLTDENNMVTMTFRK